MKRFVGLFWLVLSLVACAGPQQVSRPLPSPETALPPPPRAEGTIWSGENQFNRLFTDTKAREVGDIVTILVAENTSAEGSATTKTDRESSVDADITQLFGLRAPIRGMRNPIEVADPRGALKADIKSAFDGSGTTTRSSTLTSTLTATVIEVLPNGNLRIEGSRETKLNNERQYLVLRGVIRPKDISQDNTVLSSSIASAEIQHFGRGVISDKQRPGWLGRIVDVIWPF